jgi:hypothetical protein
MRKVLVQRIFLAVALASAAVMVSCGDDDDPAGTGPTGGMSGTIQFVGDWPPTGSIYVTVNSVYPPTGAPDAFTAAITEAMLTPQNTYDWSISGIEAGTYAAVLIGWRGGPGNDKCIGMYWEHADSLGVMSDCDPADPAISPLPVTVTKDANTQNVDMLADLNLAD